MTPPKRFPTENRDRDAYTPKTPPKGVAAQLGVVEGVDFDDLTGQFEGEELEQMRAIRAESAPEVSLTKLEKKHDALALEVGGLSKSVTDMRVEHAEQMGDVKAVIGDLAGEVKGLAVVVKADRDKDHLTFTAKVDVDRAKHISDVNVQQAEKLDGIAARKAKRDFYLKMAGSGAVGMVVLKILQHWGVL